MIILHLFTGISVQQMQIKRHSLWRVKIFVVTVSRALNRLFEIPIPIPELQLNYDDYLSPNNRAQRMCVCVVLVSCMCANLWPSRAQIKAAFPDKLFNKDEANWELEKEGVDLTVHSPYRHLERCMHKRTETQYPGLAPDAGTQCFLFEASIELQRFVVTQSEMEGEFERCLVTQQIH